MAIELTTPITVPTKTADKVWISRLIISAPDPTLPVRVHALLTPFVSSTGELIKEKQEVLVIDDLFTEASSNALVATASNAIYEAIQSVADKQEIF